MTANELRQRYLDFFSDKIRKHAIIPSAPLVPENDSTTLFMSAGMQPLVPYLMGQKHPLGTRLVNSQKCFRAVDIEEVGDTSHTTFFEMLGNWSLGDYFKQEQLSWFFEFLTKEIGLDPKKIYVTVYRGNNDLGIPKDEDAVKIWQDLFKSVGIDAKAVDMSEKEGMKDGRIFYYDEKDNWWSRSGEPELMPVGEIGGPSSEVFYDFGEQYSKEFKDVLHVNSSCKRFLEIGNSVFMTYRKNDEGNFVELPNKNIDFGGGLERILAALNNDPDVFKTQAFSDTMDEIEKWTNSSYDAENKINMRVIADHIRAAVFLIKDGVVPSNKAQGYFLRRLIRRATVQLFQIDRSLNAKDLFTIADRGVLYTYDGYYFNREMDRKLVESVLEDESKKFMISLDKALRELEKSWENRSSKFSVLPGKKTAAEEIFYYYQTYGLPADVYFEVAKKHFGGVLTPLWPIAYGENNPDEVDELQIKKLVMKEFDKLREEHAEKSRTASAGMFKGGLADQSETTVKYHTATHLLHAALRKILGEHVQQKGSNLTAERLRFDFTHPQALTEDEKKAVEDQVNAWIEADLPVSKKIMNKQDALDKGAMAFFEQKYPDEVSVYIIGEESSSISMELCGGPHVQHTGKIGKIKLTKEKSASAGVRRVYMELQK